MRLFNGSEPQISFLQHCQGCRRQQWFQQGPWRLVRGTRAFRKAWGDLQHNFHRSHLWKYRVSCSHLELMHERIRLHKPRGGDPSLKTWNLDHPKSPKNLPKKASRILRFKQHLFGTCHRSAESPSHKQQESQNSLRTCQVFQKKKVFLDEISTSWRQACQEILPPVKKPLPQEAWKDTPLYFLDSGKCIPSFGLGVICRVFFLGWKPKTKEKLDQEYSQQQHQAGGYGSLFGDGARLARNKSFARGW